MLGNLEKLEINLNNKLKVLSEVYESDMKFINNSQTGSGSSDNQEEYLREQETYMNVLD